MENIINFFFTKKKKIWHSCKFCNYHFKDEKDLSKHLWVIHKKGIGKTFTCIRCNKRFRCRNLYNKHLHYHFHWDNYKKKLNN